MLAAIIGWEARAAARRPARRRGRRRGGRRRHRRARQRRGRLGAVARGAPLAQRRGRPRARARRPLRLASRRSRRASPSCSAGFERRTGSPRSWWRCSCCARASALVVEAGRVLLEGAPRGITPREVGEAMAAHPGVEEVHDLHVWEVTSGLPRAVGARAGAARRRLPRAAARARGSSCTTASTSPTRRCRSSTRHADELLQIRRAAGTLTAVAPLAAVNIARMPMLELVQDRPDWMSALGVALTRPPGVEERRGGGRSVGGGGDRAPPPHLRRPRLAAPGRGRAGGVRAAASWARRAAVAAWQANARGDRAARPAADAAASSTRPASCCTTRSPSSRRNPGRLLCATSQRPLRPRGASARSRVSAARSRRETCICEQPMQRPISCWVSSCSKRRRTIV